LQAEGIADLDRAMLSRLVRCWLRLGCIVSPRAAAICTPCARNHSECERFRVLDATLRPPLLERLRHHLNHRVVLEQRIDLAEPIRPQLVTIGQQNLEQSPFALSSLNHARSFDEPSRAGTVVRSIDRSNWKIDRIERSVTAGRRLSVPVSELRGHFFTAK
jgi:hypothetical protein